jgi:hypothetical protein
MIQILRLKNGEDIIGEVFTDTGDYEIQEPMSVSIEYYGNQSGLVMNHWLPVQLINRNQTVIKKEDVLTTLLPNDEFAEYYMNTVERLDRLMKVKEEVSRMSDEEISEIMEDMLDTKDKILH